jgi:hypothetical protein
MEFLDLLYPGYFLCGFCRRLPLPAAAVVPCRTWRRPAAEDGHLAAFLGGQGGHGEGQHLSKAADLLLAAMPEKILDQIMDMVENVP